MQRFFILVLSAACLSVFPARAADDGTNQRFQAYLASAKFKNQMMEAGILSDAYIELGCVDKGAKFQVKGIAGVNNLKMPAGADYPTSGVWRVSFSATRCDEEIIHNTWFQARSKGRPRIIVGTPGSTITSLQLQKDLLPTLYAAAAQVPETKNCKRFKPINTKLVKAPASEKDSGGKTYTIWSENWTLLMCNRLIEIPVEFVQNSKTPGTSYVVSKNPKDIKATVREESRSVKMAEFKQAVSKIAQGTNSAIDMTLVSHMARTGFGKAQYSLAVFYLQGTRSVPQDLLKAFYWAAHAAQAGDATAMDLMGRLYVAGVFGAKDDRTALDWFNKAYKAGYTKAQVMIDTLTAQGKAD